MIGQAFLGFGFLFLGLGTMSEGIAPVKKSDVINHIFAACAENPFLGILAGTVSTMIIQSSSATIAIVQVMASQGVFGLDAALPLMLGDNIGTTITAQLAAIGGTKGARGMAMANSLFKIFGTTLFVPLLLTGLYQDGIRLIISDGIPSESGINATIMMQIAVAHSAFNIINTGIFSVVLWPVLINAAKKLSFGRGSFDTGPEDIRHLDPLLLEAPPVALEQCIKELGYMTKLCEKNIDAAFKAFMDSNLKDRGEIEQREDSIDNLQTQTTSFLARLSRLDLSEQVSGSIPDLIHSINDAERLGDHAENLIELTELKLSNKLKFAEDIRSDLEIFYGLIKRQFAAVRRALDQRDRSAVEEALRLEKQINAEHESLAGRNVTRLGDTSANVMASIVYYDLITNLERMGDRLTNIAERVSTDGA